jgi:acyl transferase domain-containing protein
MANARTVALLFPGQGSQYPKMAAGLYGHADVFTSTMDQAFRALGSQGHVIRRDWLAETLTPHFDGVTRAQPLLYAIDVALGRMVLDWGVEPAAMLGHSVGELAAATLAGVLTFAEGIGLMRDRARHFPMWSRASAHARAVRLISPRRRACARSRACHAGRGRMS